MQGRGQLTLIGIQGIQRTCVRQQHSTFLITDPPFKHVKDFPLVFIYLSTTLRFIYIYMLMMYGTYMQH